jgi:hypothetical protein
MKTIIAGCRHITDPIQVDLAIKLCPWPITEIVSGGAVGVDTLGYNYALSHDIPVEVFPADWATHSRRAGAFRNQQMADYSDCLLAVWDGNSPGTRDMIARAKVKGMRVRIHYVYKTAAPIIDEFDY